MKAVALKNLIQKTLSWETGLRDMGLRRIETSLKQGELIVRIKSTTFDTLKPGRIKLYSDGAGGGGGYSYTMALGADKSSDRYDYTPDADALKDAVKAKMMEIIEANQNEGISKAWVMLSCQDEQAKRMRAALVSAAPVAPIDSVSLPA